MKKLYLKLFLAFLPIILLLIIYFYKDPFRVLYNYNSYYSKNKPIYITLDKDYISTQNFINKYATYHYDSYIFGNSRSMYYQIDSWEKHISGFSCYHFDASGESLYGIEKKIRFLDRRAVKIKNALFIIDETILAEIHNQENAFQLKHPALSGENKISFELLFVKMFFDQKFLLSYLDLLMNNNYKKSMSDVFINVRFDYNDTNNEISNTFVENAIKNNPDSFYNSLKYRFFKRSTTEQYDKRYISLAGMQMLNNIKQILVKDSTNYKIVISPMYNQIKINSYDLEVLKQIFGNENVFDFSGINKITENIRNYYEEAHYRPFIANEIMDSIYKNAVTNKQ